MDQASKHNAMSTTFVSRVGTNCTFLDCRRCDQPVFESFRKLPGFDCCWITTICYEASRDGRSNELAHLDLHLRIHRAHCSYSDAYPFKQLTLL